MFIYFEQGKCKQKIFILSAVFCVVGSAQNVVSGQITVSGGILLQAVTHRKKKIVSSDVSEIIRSEITNRKYQSVRFYVGYVDTLKFIKVLNFTLKEKYGPTSEVVVRQKKPIR
jgi:hypothetical protein